MVKDTCRYLQEEGPSQEPMFYISKETEAQT